MKLLAKNDADVPRLPRLEGESSAVPVGMGNCWATSNRSVGNARTSRPIADFPGETVRAGEHEGRRPARGLRAGRGSGYAQVRVVSGYSGVGSLSRKRLNKVLVPPRGFSLQANFDQYKRDTPYATKRDSLQTLSSQSSSRAKRKWTNGGGTGGGRGSEWPTDCGLSERRSS